jgi:hypothetical protein
MLDVLVKCLTFVYCQQINNLIRLPIWYLQTLLIINLNNIYTRNTADEQANKQTNKQQQQKQNKTQRQNDMLSSTLS